VIGPAATGSVLAVPGVAADRYRGAVGWCGDMGDLEVAA
jgi:hypothetical protein